MLCCTRVGLSRQSAAVPRLCPLLRVVGLTDQLIAGHEGPALSPERDACLSRPSSTTINPPCAWTRVQVWPHSRKNLCEMLGSHLWQPLFVTSGFSPV